MSDKITCPRCGSLSDTRITRRDQVCEHCRQPFGDLSVPDHAGRLTSGDDTDDPSRRRRSDVHLWVSIALTLVGVAAVVLMMLFMEKGRDGGLCLSCSFVPVFVLLDVTVSIASVRLLQRYWPGAVGANEGRTAGLFGLLLAGVLVGVVIVFFVTCRGLLAIKGVSL